MSHTYFSTPFRWVGRLLLGPLYDPSPQPERRKEFAELVSLVFTVCLTIFLVKTFIAYRDLNRYGSPPAVVMEGFWVSMAQVWACSAQDFAVGLGCLLLGSIGLRLIRSAACRRGLRIGAHVAAAAAISYMIVNAQIFHVLRCFLSLTIFQAGGGFTPERSIYAYANTTMKVALALLPLLALALHLLLVHKLARFWINVSALVIRPLLLLAGIWGLCYVTTETQHTLFNDHRSDFTENVHLFLVRSLFRSDMGLDDVGPEPPETAEYEPGRPRHSGLVLAKRPTNVIVIVLESSGALYFNHCGYPLPNTPRLCQLEPRSLTFDTFYATSNRTIAAALPLCGAMWNDPHSISTTIEYPRFPVPMASSWLRERGYRTAFLGAGGDQSWLGYNNLTPAFGSAGWDVTRDSSNPFWSEGGNRERFRSPEYLDKAMFADASRFLRSARKDKFFLMMWNYDTHAPFFGWDEGTEWDASQFPPTVRGLPQEEEYRRFLSAIKLTDARIGALYDELEVLGLADDTLVVVTGDHGESWGQHGCFAHGNSLYDEEVRVPLVLINRHLAAAAGTRSSVVGSHVDVWATITDICGLPFNSLWQGHSLLGDAAEERRAYFSRRGGVGVREGRFKYIWDYESRRELLFDMLADPGERHNLAAEQRDYCLRQRRRLRDWTVSQEEITRERLRLDVGE